MTAKTNLFFLEILLKIVLVLQHQKTVTPGLESTSYKTSSSDEVCESSNSSQYGVTWLSTTTKNVSSPLCTNQAKELSYRECINGQWAPEPECIYTQFTTPSECPTGYKETDDFCYTFTEKTTFPPPCPFVDVLPFNDYIGVITDDIPEAIWMPVTRRNLQFLQWVESSILYNAFFDDQYTYDGKIRNKNCAVFYPNQTKKAVSCQERHLGVCAYKKLTKLVNTLCDLYHCKQSDYSSKTTCFCYVQNETVEYLAEFVYPYQNSLYESLTNRDNCLMGLIINEERAYVWSSSQEEIFYTFWSPYVSFTDSNRFGIFTPLGWSLSNETIKPGLQTKKISPEELKVSFEFDGKDKLTLSISDLNLVQHYGGGPTVFCFTDADDLTLYRREVVELTESSYSFEILDGGIGMYWCEFFNRADLALVRTEKKILSKKLYFEFVTVFGVSYPSENFNPLSDDIITYMEKLVFDKFVDNEFFYKPKFFGIVDLIETRYIIWVNIHFVSNSTFNSLLVDEHHQHLKNQIMTSLNISDQFYLIDIFNTDYCLKETVYTDGSSLTWPTSPAGQVVTPNEMCFTARGDQVQRRCNWNYVNGSRWSDFEYCQVLPKSSITNEILAINSDSAPLDKITNLLEKYSLNSFTALDIYFLQTCLKSAIDFNQQTVDIKSFAKIINSISEMDTMELAAAQFTTRSIDNLLDLIERVISTYSEKIEIFEENFAVIQDTSANFSGLLIQKIDGRRNITKLYGDWSFEDIQNEKNVMSAIWLSSELRSKIDKAINIAFTVYFDDSFFSEIGTSLNIENNIFGIFIENLTFYIVLEEPIYIFQNDSSDPKTTRSCFFWNYLINQHTGFWFKDGDVVKNQEKFYEVRHVGSFAVIDTDNTFTESNVTSALADLLGSNLEIAARDRVDILLDLSENSEDFAPIDIFLFGKILEMVDNNETDLEALAGSISNLHNSKKSVLLQSQKKKQATDNILINLDAIIQNNNETSEFFYTKENFVVFVSNILRNNIGGVAVLKNDSRNEIKILRGYFSVEHLLEIENLDSALLFSWNLRQQLFDNDQMSLTIFFNDKLFNTNKKHKFISTIYNVLLPQVGNFSGPISIFHNISAKETDTIDCSHWKFKKINESDSSWQKDEQEQHVSGLVQCDFWHATHFALLILDEDLYNSSKEILDWITYVNSGISILGLLGIIFTAIFFKKWRKNVGNQILFNFSIAIMIQLFAFFGVAVFDMDYTISCIILGVVLHYSVIAQFCWMFVIAILQFKRFVKVFASSNTYLLLKTSLFGWGLPLIPVILSLITDESSYSRSQVGFCYPSGLILYLGVWLPLLTISIMNLCIFIYIMYNVIYIKIEPSIPTKNEGKYQWRLFILLFFMLGLTWAFGFLAEWKFGELFVYLFCLTATLQGFILFIYFIVLNSNTRFLYKQAIRNCCSRKVQ